MTGSECLDLLLRSAPLFCKGALTTLQVLALSALFSVGAGLCLGLITCNRLKTPGFSHLAAAYCFIARGVPFYVLLLIFYFVIPDLLGCNLGPLAASILALGISSSGYAAHIVRGALNAIPAAQWEAAYVLGYSPLAAFTRIIFPQMARLALPTFHNECESLLKSTAVVSSIGLVELTRVGMNLVSREMEPVPIYLALAFFYLIISAALHAIAKRLERRFYVKY